MGLFFGFFMVNVFLCFIEEKLERENMLLGFYKRYVDDILVIMFNVLVVIVFFFILNECYLFI